jgi:ribosomal protein S18 acetylase RimI-like enzyme
MSTTYQPRIATVLSVAVADDVATVEIEISREDYLDYPIAPACLWNSKTREVFFPFDQLVRHENHRLRFETYRSEHLAPKVGDVAEFCSSWNHWAMDAVRDISADWERKNYPYDGEHDHCILTCQAIANYSEHKEGYVSEHGWVTVEAYQKYIENDQSRIRSNWRSIERRPTELHRITDMATSAADSVEGVVVYALEPALSTNEFVDLLRRSGLAERRPVDDQDRIAGMLANCDLLLSARTYAGLLIGVSRAISDFHYCTYLSDLAVDRDFQRQGIGRELIRRTHEAAGFKTRLILLSAPAAQEYYPHIGMQRHDSCWVINPTTRPGF